MPGIMYHVRKMDHHTSESHMSYMVYQIHELCRKPLENAETIVRLCEFLGVNPKQPMMYLRMLLPGELYLYRAKLVERHHRRSSWAAFKRKWSSILGLRRKS